MTVASKRALSYLRRLKSCPERSPTRSGRALSRDAWSFAGRLPCVCGRFDVGGVAVGCSAVISDSGVSHLKRSYLRHVPKICLRADGPVADVRSVVSERQLSHRRSLQP